MDLSEWCENDKNMLKSFETVGTIDLSSDVEYITKRSFDICSEAGISPNKLYAMSANEIRSLVDMSRPCNCETWVIYYDVRSREWYVKYRIASLISSSETLDDFISEFKVN